METQTPSLALNTGHQMPQLGLGTFHNFKKGEVIEAVKCAIECGYRHVDAAWIYQSEGEVGDAVADVINRGIVKREDLFITTKLWSIFHAPHHVEAGLRESLSDLKLDYVDLFLMHWPMPFQEPEDKRTWIMSTDILPGDTDYIDTWRAMETLVEKGLVRSIGVSNFNISQLKRLLAADNLRYKPANMQIEINPYMDNKELVNYCLEHGITVTAFSPLGKGGQEYAGKTIPNLLQEAILLDLARKYNKTAAQIALRWGIQRGYAVVPKSVTPKRIAENMQFFDFQLTSEEMQSVSSLNKDMRLVDLKNFKTFPYYPF